MIPIEKQVVSKELSERLKALGVVQESYFHWVGDSLWDSTMGSDYETPSTPLRDDWVSAFTVAELGEMLPGSIVSLKDGFSDFKWRCERIGGDGYVSASGGDSEADSRARMLIYLVENKVV